jgi:hypothetical protein
MLLDEMSEVVGRVRRDEASKADKSRAQFIGFVSRPIKLSNSHRYTIP